MEIECFIDSLLTDVLILIKEHEDIAIHDCTYTAIDKLQAEYMQMVENNGLEINPPP